VVRIFRAVVRRLRAYQEPKALVLMYHRVAEPATDVWDLAVSPTNFEQQLRVLQRSSFVVPAEELVSRLTSKTLRRRSIVITFDDGYCDNYLAAKSLLEQYKLPATFFIATGNLGQASEFWWDELEDIFLLTEHLPAAFDLAIVGQQVVADLRAEQALTDELRHQHRQWQVMNEPPPTARATLFFQVWQLLKLLPHAEQQLVIQQLRAWVGQPALGRPAYQSMSASQVRALGSELLFTIGAHTITHMALGSHPAAVQKHELATSRQVLSQLAERVSLVSYPYGEHTDETVAIAAELGFEAAFTTDAQPIRADSARLRLGRFQVNNWTGEEFKRHLNQWFG
jgi:peptidoglycan/xylan/chitin deacetylase (PgdA/CDA1 family)